MDRYRTATASSSLRLDRRAVLLGFGALAITSMTAACGTGGTPATPQASRAAGTNTGEQIVPTATAATSATNASPTVTSVATQAPAATAPLPLTVTAVPTIAIGPTVTPVPLPAFSTRVVTADMADANQWNTIVLESSARTLANNAYTVRVTKWPDGRGLLSWGDWLPKNVTLAPQFGAEAEMQLTGDAVAAGGILFNFNFVSATERQQYLVFLIRADGRFKIEQQLPGGMGHNAVRVDWTQTSAIKQGANATNIARVIARDGLLICGVNGRQVAQLPVPAELAGFRGFALAADVPIESTQMEATATFRNLRYETFS